MKKLRKKGRKKSEKFVATLNMVVQLRSAFAQIPKTKIFKHLS